MSTLSTRRRSRSAQGAIRPFEGSAPSILMPQASTLVPRKLSPVCPRAMPSRSCARLAPPPSISRRWPTGVWRVALRPSPWNPPESIGFPGVRSWKPVGSIAASSVRHPSSMSPGASVMSWTVNGFRPCTVMDCCRPHFVRRRTSSRCARCYAIVPSSSSIVLPMSSIGKRRSYR